MTRYDAVVLAGGASRRLGGVDKLGLVVGSRSLLEHAICAAAGAGQTIVVGPQRPVPWQVRWTREEPAGAGPAAAAAAGLAFVDAELVVLLAGDLPFITADVVTDLASAAESNRGALVLDATGYPQWLLSAWRTEDLRKAMAETPLVGAALRSVLGSLPYTSLAVDPWVATDCDTPADLEVARTR